MKKLNVGDIEIPDFLVVLALSLGLLVTTGISLFTDITQSNQIVRSSNNQQEEISRLNQRITHLENLLKEENQ